MDFGLSIKHISMIENLGKFEWKQYKNKCQKTCHKIWVNTDSLENHTFILVIISKLSPKSIEARNQTNNTLQ